MANTVDWIEIRATDIQKITAFYRSLFGWEVAEEETVNGSNVVILDTRGEPRLQNLRRAGIFQVSQDKHTGFVVYIRVDDLDSMAAKAISLGAKTASPKIELPGGYCVTIIDPCGNLFAMYQDK